MLTRNCTILVGHKPWLPADKLYIFFMGRPQWSTHQYVHLYIYVYIYTTIFLSTISEFGLAFPGGASAEYKSSKWVFSRAIYFQQAPLNNFKSQNQQFRSRGNIGARKTSQAATGEHLGLIIWRANASKATAFAWLPPKPSWQFRK